MKISTNCLDLIKKWEGFRPAAYRDPADIPTIGYGTIRYSDGEPVRMGDRITEQQALGYLHEECEDIAKQVSNMVEPEITQNQFDALVSFAYNVGPAALKNSTLRKKLNAGDPARAAEEFKRWNKATINGVKQVLSGLVSRRADETALFTRQTAQGTPIDTPVSKQDGVNSLKVFRSETANLIVAYKGAGAMEILRLETTRKEDFIDLLKLYPSAHTLELAAPGEALPDGEIIAFTGRTKTLCKVIDHPKLNRKLLLRGMRDEDEPGNDVKELQARLQALGYYQAKVDGIFGRVTDKAAKDFQADAFGVWEADGKVGPLTWSKLWGERNLEQSAKPPATGRTYLQLTKTSRKDGFGLFVLLMEYVDDGKIVDSIEVCSGQPRHQELRTGPASRSMSKEPLPEGRWTLSKKIHWCGGEDIYDGCVFADGEGPVKIRLEYDGPGTTERSAILIHLDWNRNRRAPGTLGCIGVYDVPDFRKLVGWVREGGPRHLYVDWGLGTCPEPG